MPDGLVWYYLFNTLLLLLLAGSFAMRFLRVGGSAGAWFSFSSALLLLVVLYASPVLTGTQQISSDRSALPIRLGPALSVASVVSAAVVLLSSCSLLFGGDDD